jgi:hypothetical protein
MNYGARTGGATELIWNSRDGVTPFGIGSKAPGKSMLEHVAWKEDKCNPLHVPEVGERVFVDLTLERAMELRNLYVQAMWDHPDYPMHVRWRSMEEAVSDLAWGDYMSFWPHSPDVVVVDRDLHYFFKERAKHLKKIPWIIEAALARAGVTISVAVESRPRFTRKTEGPL